MNNYTEVVKKMKNSNCGTVYGLGLIGAAIYYIQNANTLVDGLFGIIKAVVWPGVLVYKVLEFLQL